MATAAHTSPNLTRSLLLALALPTAALLAVSFMPTPWKTALHTRGSLHGVLHVCAFATLIGLWFRCTQSRPLRLLLLASAVLLGFGIELFQASIWHFPIERADVAADALGACAGALLSSFSTRRLRTPALSSARIPGYALSNRS